MTWWAWLVIGILVELIGFTIGCRIFAYIELKSNPRNPDPVKIYMPAIFWPVTIPGLAAYSLVKYLYTIATRNVFNPKPADQPKGFDPVKVENLERELGIVHPTQRPSRIIIEPRYRQRDYTVGDWGFDEDFR